MADKNLRVSIMLQMAEKVLGPLKNISQGSNETAQTLKAAREQLKQLQAVQGDIGSFQRLQQTLGETESKLKSTREHLRATANAFAENDTHKTSAAMLSAAQAANKLGAKFNVQQQRLQQEFKTLLVRTYAGALAQVKNETISVKPLRAQPTDTDVLVRTEVRGRAEPVQLDYRLEKTPGEGAGWKIYNLNVMGVWLVETYRNQFTQEINTRGVDGLLASLAERNAAGTTK